MKRALAWLAVFALAVIGLLAMFDVGAGTEVTPDIRFVIN